MTLYAPHERDESGPSSLNHTSCSSSSPSPRRGAPSTPPQIHSGLGAFAASSGPGFSGFFPWVKQDLREHVEAQSLRDGVPSAGTPVGHHSYVAALEQRDVSCLPQDTLLSPSSQTTDVAVDVEGMHRAPSPSRQDFVHTSMIASSSSPRQPHRPLMPASPLPPSACGAQDPIHYAMAADQECCARDEVLDILEDDRIPGYQVWTRGSTSSSVVVVRIPRQLMGWKAVLMDGSGLGEASLSPGAAVSRGQRRASKVLGKQGWEVRQEALKNSYDFRRGSGIWATMHAGQRLFKHDWHIIVKDGSRYVWRMDRQALALFREDDDVKVAEFCKAVLSSGTNVGTDSANRIGSFRFLGQRSRIRPGHSQQGTIFGLNLALASLIAVFGARGGHNNVSAAYEPSSDPRRDMLEQQRQETPDREQVMLALPRPGFARDAESVLSDTTDEDAGEPTDDTVQHLGGHREIASQQRLPPPTSHSSGVRSPQTHAESDREGTGKNKPGGRKRFSSFFGRGSAPVEWQGEARRSVGDSVMTDSQRIARQYRTRSVMLGT